MHFGRVVQVLAIRTISFWDTCWKKNNAVAYFQYISNLSSSCSLGLTIWMELANFPQLNPIFLFSILLFVAWHNYFICFMRGETYLGHNRSKIGHSASKRQKLHNIKDNYSLDNNILSSGRLIYFILGRLRNWLVLYWL